MARPLPSREFNQIMLRAGCTERKCKSSHAMWTCPCGKHRSSIVSGHRIVDAGDIRGIKNRFTCVQIDFYGE